MFAKQAEKRDVLTGEKICKTLVIKNGERCALMNETTFSYISGKKDFIKNKKRKKKNLLFLLLFYLLRYPVD